MAPPQKRGSLSESKMNPIAVGVVSIQTGGKSRTYGITGNNPWMIFSLDRCIRKINIRIVGASKRPNIRDTTKLLIVVAKMAYSGYDWNGNPLLDIWSENLDFLNIEQLSHITNPQSIEYTQETILSNTSLTKEIDLLAPSIDSHQITTSIVTETSLSNSPTCHHQNMHQNSHSQTDTSTLGDVGIPTSPPAVDEQVTLAIPKLSTQPILQFTSASETQTHKQRPHALKPGKIYTCKEHNIQTSNDRLFGKHMWEVHKIKYFACLYCDWRTARHDNLKRDHASRCQKNPQKVARLSTTAGYQNKKRVSLKDSEKPFTITTAQIAVESYPEMAAKESASQIATDTETSQELRIRELENKLAVSEQENRDLREDCSMLEDDLKEAQCNRDMWREECKRLRQENRSRLK
ncbi:hypothetical protein AA313_de0202584 [Arthrobotrys entomopaga]|nr:hypothetical protein AA313_de0202584 [Arthrobotrys entomopaga]